MRRVRIEPEAEADLQSAAEWYEAQEPGLGLSLLGVAATTTERIAAGDHGTPTPHTSSGARRLGIPKFPLWIVFIEGGDEVVIVAYAHERRRPGYWLGRLPRST
jgi:plasmid stabilization system protein ParE